MSLTSPFLLLGRTPIYLKPGVSNRFTSQILVDRRSKFPRQRSARAVAFVHMIAFEWPSDQQTTVSPPREVVLIGVRTVSYKIVAEKDGKTVTTERASLLIAAARARVWSSEGWTVDVTDGDGKLLDPATFDQLLAA
jgi:hypothetical protein